MCNYDKGIFTVEFQVYIHLINLCLVTQCCKYPYFLISSKNFGFIKSLHSRRTPRCGTISLPLQRKAHFRPYIRKQNPLDTKLHAPRLSVTRIRRYMGSKEYAVRACSLYMPTQTASLRNLIIVKILL